MSNFYLNPKVSYVLKHSFKQLRRGAKIDLCLERVHEFLKRRKSTTLTLEDFLMGRQKVKEQLLKKHDLIYFEEPSSLLDAIEVFYEGIDTSSSFSDLLVENQIIQRSPSG